MNARERTLLALRELALAIAAQLEEERALAALPPPGADEALSLTEAAAELCEPVTTIRQRCQRGVIKGEKRGKLWKITRAELARYRERARRQAAIRASRS